jgi:hypothetical protein
MTKPGRHCNTHRRAAALFFSFRFLYSYPNFLRPKEILEADHKARET